MFRSSRKLLFLSALAAVVCVLGAFDYAQSQQQQATSLVTAEDFNQFSWRFVGPMSFSGRTSGFAVPRGQSQTYYALMASGGIWKTEDGGTHFEPILRALRHREHGLAGHRAVEPQHPLPRHR